MKKDDPSPIVVRAREVAHMELDRREARGETVDPKQRAAVDGDGFRIDPTDMNGDVGVNIYAGPDLICSAPRSEFPDGSWSLHPPA
jgi:hypothetical protein